MFSIFLFTFLVILFVYSIIHRRIEQNAEYFRSRNIKYKGFSHSMFSLINMFFGKTDVLEFTQRNYNAVPTEPYVYQVHDAIYFLVQFTYNFLIQLFLDCMV